jgi:bifunctional non-homologous end joining protein LigD
MPPRPRTDVIGSDQPVLTHHAYSGCVPDAPLEELPRFIPPMLASAGAAPVTAGWAMEVDWDGIRAQLRFDGRSVCVRSRQGRNCTPEFPELVELHETIAGWNLLLDGELVCLGPDGKPDFLALRRRLTSRVG